MQGNSALLHLYQEVRENSLQAQATQASPWQQRRGEKRPASKGGLLRAIRYLSRHPRSTIPAYLALLVATGAQLMVPQLVQNMIEAVTNGMIAKIVLNLPSFVQSLAADKVGRTLDQMKLDFDNAESLLYTAVWTIVAFAVMRAAFSFIQAYMAENTSQGIAFDFRNELFSKIQRLSFSYYDRNQTGQLMIRATDDVEKVRLFIAQGLIMTVQSLLLLVGALTILAITNWQLMLVVLPILPVAMVVFIVFGALGMPLFGEMQIRLSRLNTVLQENLAGIKVIKSFVREPHEQKRFNEATDRQFEQGIKVARMFTFLFPLIFLIAQIGQASLLYFAGGQILNETLTLGEYQKFSLYVIFVFFPLMQLGFIITLLAQASASADRIFEILDAKSDIVEKAGAVDLPHIKGKVEFKDVTFRYFSSGEPVLNKVSFTAKPGQTIALLGGTGSGKSSIINLIPRFYDASEGAVLIDGHDIKDVKLDSLRSQIGIVLQETTLFSGSIRDNIAFGRSDATLEEVIAVATAALAHEFIMSFPQGYDTPVGERGTTLSGGQKQRVAIARALLMNPRLLILDDSTSSVDLMTEFRIQKALDELMKGRTSVVIAQRITTVLNADQIIVLDKGEVAEIGTHEHLMENSPIYAEIYNSQLVGDIDEKEALAQAAQEAK
jgi:ATP-binding cassette subfamily B protein